MRARPSPGGARWPTNLESRSGNSLRVLHDETVAQRAAVVGRSDELLERGDQIAALAGTLGEVRQSAQGRVVLVGAEAGGGKTALLRRFCEGSGARVLWGACDPLFTPRPLGPLIGVADDVGGELSETIGAGAGPHEVTTALVRELTA